jgi:LAT3 family solute carrier family 43 protein 3
LGVIFTVGSWSTQGGRFLAGIARDHFWGTRNTAAFCIAATASGIVGIAFADKNDVVALGISLFLVGLGSGAQLCLQPVAELFEKQGAIMLTFSGVFQISGLMFLILLNITSDRRKCFIPFAIVLFGIAVISFILLPKDKFSKHVKEEKAIILDDVEEDNVFGGSGIDIDSGHDDDVDESQEISNGDDQNIDNAVDSNPQSEKGPMELMRTWEYVLLLTWFSVQFIPLQYYIATIGFQLERIGDDDGKYTSISTIVYAACALVGPFFGKIADSAGLGCGQAIATILTSVSFFILSLEESISLDLHVVGMICYGIARLAVFGCFFTNVGKRFGYTHYGTLVGSGLLFSAIASLLQYPLITIAAGGRERVVNISSGSLLLIQGLPYCYWLFRKERMQYQQAQNT